MPTSVKHFHETRATSSYRDGWSHLDQWDSIRPFALKLTAGAYQDDDGEGDWWRFKHVARLPRDVPYDVAVKAIKDNMSGSNCRHSHDCCGCVASYVDVIRISRRQICIRVTFSRNL
jgi:hypothetical protein